VTAHFALNELKRTGALGPFAAPSRGALLLGAAVAVLAVVMLDRLGRVPVLLRDEAR
jgi:hypothetical protein